MSQTTTVHETETPSKGRSTNGQFTRGNAGGPGNPFGRRLASMREAILRAVSDEDIGQIMTSMVNLAKEGNIQAAKLVLQYAVGKPAPVAQPDRVDEEEWDIEKAKSIPQEEVVGAIEGMPVDAACVTAAASPPARRETFVKMLTDGDAEELDDISIEEERKAMQAAEERFARQYEAGEIEPLIAPSRNGSNGRRSRCGTVS